jgi:broad specificity phosphatase PhoE
MNNFAALTITSLLIAFVGCSSVLEPEPSTVGFKPVVVFAVRHAEKADLSEDPELSEEGEERAEVLARMLRSAKLDYVHASPFMRTRNTAAPAAVVHGLKVQNYDPRDLPGLIENIREAGGRHLIVGHRNTTPILAELLSGRNSEEPNGDGEFDRLYVVTVGKDGVASSVLMRYGNPYVPNAIK